MKKFIKALLFGLIVLAVMPSMAQKTINRNSGEEFQKVKTTTDSTFTSVDSCIINSNEVGFVDVQVVGLDKVNGKAVTGHLKYRYKSVSGTITLASADALSAIVTDSGLSPATFKVIASGSKLYLQVKGKLTVTVDWYTVLKRKALYK